MDSEPNCSAVSSKLSSPLALDFSENCNLFISLLLTDCYIHKHGAKSSQQYVIAMSLIVKPPLPETRWRGFSSRPQCEWVRAGKQTFSSDRWQMAGCQVEPPVHGLIYIAAGSELKAAHQRIKSWSVRVRINAPPQPPLPPWWQKVERSVAFIGCKVQYGWNNDRGGNWFSRV